MIKPKLYTRQKLSGFWLVTRKLDGVRALKDAGKFRHPRFIRIREDK